MTYAIHIDYWHPTPLNKLLHAHWADAAKMKAADAQMIGVYAHQAKVPKATGKRSVGIAITLGKGQRGCDPDAYHKSTHDALVRLGYLKNDNRQWLEIIPTTYDRADNRATTITIAEVV